MTSKKVWLIIVMMLLIVSSVSAGSYSMILQDADVDNLEDSRTESGAGTGNYGSDDVLSLFASTNVASDDHYSFIMFNTNFSSIASSATIDDSELCLYLESNYMKLNNDDGSFNVTIHEIYPYPAYDIGGNKWTESTITWNTQPSTSTHYNTTFSDSLFFDKTVDNNQWICWNTTSILRKGYDNNYNNVSFFLKSIPNGDGSLLIDYADRLEFTSKEDTFYTTKRPILNIDYTINESPVLSLDYNYTHPVNPLPSQDLKFNITCSQSVIDFSTSMTGYVQLYNNSVLYGGVQSLGVINDTETTIYTLDSHYTGVGEEWTGEYWCGDGYTNTTKQNNSVTITNPIVNLVTVNNTYTTDTTPNIQFNISSNHDMDFNCSLYVDTVLKSTVNNIFNDTNTYITSTSLSQGTREYYVGCVYEGSNTITSSNQNIIIDTTTPSITLSSPTNSYIETTDSTPDFSFTVSEDINTTTTCELLIGGVGYGTNTSVLNNTLTTITANTTLTDANYQWRIKCSDQFYTGYSLYRTIIINLNNPNVNITFYDEETGLVVDTTNISLDIITDYYSANYTTEDGWINVTLIEDVVNAIRYSASGYVERLYYVTPTNDSSYPLTLYMLLNTSAYPVTFTVVDQNAESVEGALVKALKYDVGTNNYVLREVGSTNFLGETTLSLTYNDEFYKFQVEYEGETKVTTNPLYIQSDSYTIQIITDEGAGQEFDHYKSLDYELTYNNATGNFRLEYNDITGLLDQVCLYVYNTTLFNKVLINSTCLSTASGTILTGITPTNNTSYEAKAYYTKDSKTSYLTGYSVSFTTDPNFANFGLLLQIIITTTFALMALWKIEVSAIITPLSLILGRMIGLTSFDYLILVPLLVVGIIIAMITGNRK